MAHTKEARPSSANGQESTSADVAVETASVDSGRAYGPQYPPKHVAGLRCTGLMLEMHRNFPRLSAKIEHHSDWPKAFLQTNVFLMRGLIGLVKSIVLMGRIYRMDSYRKAFLRSVVISDLAVSRSLASNMVRARVRTHMAKEVLWFRMASCAQGVVQLRPVRCEDFAMSLAGQPSHILAGF